MTKSIETQMRDLDNKIEAARKKPIESKYLPLVTFHDIAKAMFNMPGVKQVQVNSGSRTLYVTHTDYHVELLRKELYHDVKKTLRENLLITIQFEIEEFDYETLKLKFS